MLSLEEENAADRSAAIAAFRRGEAGGVRAMYREYGRLVYAVTHRVLRRDDLAQEAVQQTFVQAWQAADRLDLDVDPRRWLVTIARNAAIDVLRHEARRPTAPLDESVATTPPPDLARLDAVWRVRRAIDELPADEATIMRLQHLDGLTQTEIADALGLALGTVKSRSYRAHRHLAARLADLQPDSVDGAEGDSGVGPADFDDDNSRVG